MKKIVLFGDSITAGYLNNQNTDILDQLLVQDLANVGFPGYTIINRGVNGETSRDALQRVTDVQQEAADFVVVFFGDNDALDQKVPVPEYQENLQKIVTEIGAEKVLLIGPSYIRTMEQDVLKEYIEAAKIVGSQALSFLDMYHHMTVYPGVNEFIQTDGLHISEVGYDLLSSLIARDIKGRLLAKNN